MTYRVSTNRTGEKRWWCAWDTIPATHTDIRPATPDEATLMDQIINADGAPSLALGERVMALMNA